MSVQAIDALGPTEPTLYGAKAPDDLGKTDFLTLLIAQIQMQDPLNPQDSAEFTSQLTQFSSLEQLMSVKDSIDGMNDSIIGLQMLQMSSNNTQAISLIGKDILYEGDSLNVTGGQAEDVRFFVSGNLQNAQATIRAADGSVVRTIDLGSRSQGTHTAGWDGRSSAGDPLPDGSYTVRISGVDQAGNSVSLPALAFDRATGVYFEEGVTYLELGGKRIELGSVYGVHEPSGVS